MVLLRGSLRREDAFVDAAPARSALSTTVFGVELVRAPATVMAGGIFLLGAAPFLLSFLGRPELAASTLRAGMWLLAALYAFIAVLFVLQLRSDPEVLWGRTVDHFAIGTWVAGTNVLARVIHPAHPLVGKGLTLAGWTLALLYAYWVVTAISRTTLLGRVNGIAFLTTVAMQSVVLTSEALLELSESVLHGLLVLNAIGLLVYAFCFGRVWSPSTLRRQIETWAPVNNITHGALSISVLAAETLAAKMAAPPALLLIAIQAVWAVSACFFVTILLLEVGLVARGRNLLSFRVSNYARNFTYGMFFTCTYHGVTQFRASLMAMIATPPVLLILAALVAAVNLWEFGRHLARSLRPAPICQLEAESA
jgi:hypothetical protein